MGKLIDLTGRQFGRLTVIGRSARNDTEGRAKWDCECSCGNLPAVRGNSLKRGLTKSCGCLHKNHPGLYRRVNVHGLSLDDGLGKW